MLRARKPRNAALLLLLCTLVSASIASAGRAVWIEGKASVAQFLLLRAWSETLSSGKDTKPWPWADTVPVAKLHAIDSEKTMIVLDGASGQAMAFGPARINYDASLTAVAGTGETAAQKSADSNGQKPLHLDNIGELSNQTFDSTIAIAGHRDTHMTFLQSAEPGDRFELENRFGERQQYQLRKKQIINVLADSLSINRDQSGLVLITCFPFNAMQTGGPLRMIAIAEPVTTPSAPK